MKKKTLYIVTGAAGHLAARSCACCISAGCGSRAAAPGRDARPSPGLPYVYGDVRDVGSLRPLFEDAGADRIAVIHTAGIVGIADTPTP